MTRFYIVKFSRFHGSTRMEYNRKVVNSKLTIAEVLNRRVAALLIGEGLRVIILPT